MNSLYYLFLLLFNFVNAKTLKSLYNIIRTLKYITTGEQNKFGIQITNSLTILTNINITFTNLINKNYLIFINIKKSKHYRF